MIRIILYAVLLSLLSGCSSKETLYQIEPPPDTLAAVEDISLSENERWIAADTEVVVQDLGVYDERTAIKAPFTDNVFTTYSAWEKAANATGGEVLSEKLDRYGKDFFSANALCCCTESTSAGMGYIIEGVSIGEKDEKNTLTLYVSYSERGMMNHLANYYFFVEMNTADSADIDEISIIKYSRS
ncbi:MAG: hypothetical protein E7478_06575 [Ruminococcaceae bacterium]|nr:hypothetical protein [Oscillospiraceae bacterium]